MTAPTVDPILLQVMDKLAAELAGISQDAGYYSDVAAAGIEPLSFGPEESYPQILVQLEADQITDSNAKAYVDSTTLKLIGYVKFETGAIRPAIKLLDDITQCAGALAAADFVGANGRQLIKEYQVLGNRTISISELAADFLEVAVLVDIDVQGSFPPATGTR